MVSQFALELLKRPAAGDWTLAGTLLVWSGGAAYGFKQSLQEAFSSAGSEKKHAFSQPVRRGLVDPGLLTEPRKKHPPGSGRPHL